MATNKGFISHRNGNGYTICRSDRVLCFNTEYAIAVDALKNAGVEDPDSVIEHDTPSDVFWPTFLCALNSQSQIAGESADSKASRDEVVELRAHLDAASHALGELASEFEAEKARRILERRVSELETTITVSIPRWRAWLQSHTLPMFDVQNDQLVRNWIVNNTKDGLELQRLQGVLNG